MSLNFDPNEIQKNYEKKKKEYIECEKAVRIAKFYQELEHSGFTPELYLNFKNFRFKIIRYNGKKDNKHVAVQIKKWIKETHKDKPFLILYGNFGTGKTMTAGNIATKKFKKDRQVIFISKKDFDLRITNFENEDVNELIDRMKKIDLLVIDDILSGYLTDYRFSQLFSVLDYRYLHRKTTIITANEDLRKVKGKGSDFERLKDRLFEVAEFVYFDYPSFRSGKFKEIKEISF